MLPLPPPPSNVAFPTVDWPVGDLAPEVDAGRLAAAIDRAFSQPPELGLTFAVVAVHRGRIVTERYNTTGEPPTTAETTLISWSMAKSVVHALIGVLARQGRIDIHAPAPVPAWHTTPGDPRAAITTEHLLRMNSGLRWVEDYVDDSVSHVIDMLFGDGMNDVAAYASSLPADHVPGAFWNYSSGTTNILARIVTDILGGGESGMREFMHRELFEPLGMRSADPRFDTAGTFVGSSFLYCTAHDFARFGLLYMRDGVWDGVRLLPEGWVDHARTFTPGSQTDEVHDYGAQFWLWRGALGGLGTFGCHGYEGQHTLIVPALDLVLVRLGKSPADVADAMRDNVREMVLAFAQT
jgi:CubicO group peptidase (beta-lactamase class C family)